jgi:alpha-L-fucosidase
MKIPVLACALAACLAPATLPARAGGPPADGTAPAWLETPAQRDARMAWWRAARFGIFVHWGVYSRLEGTWEGKEVDGPGEWILESGHIPASAYTREAKKFDPKSYDPVAWAGLFAEAGAKYVVITSRHHDGFCLWPSKFRVARLWDEGDARDYLAPLKSAVESKGLKFGLYYSIMDWTHPDWRGRRAWNDLWPARPPEAAKFEPYVENQLEEIIRDYRPAILWFDGEWEDAWTRAEGERVGAFVRSHAPQAIVNDRFAKGRERMKPWSPGEPADFGDYGTPEQEVPRRTPAGVDWETCMTMNDTWGYKASDHDFKTTRQLIRTLVDVASKGGNFLLNVGPDGDGRIPETSVQRLKGMGAWLAVNGEAIYSTKAGPLARLPYGRTTQRDGVVYVHVFDWPGDGRLLVPGLKNKVTKARLVGSPDARITWDITEEGVGVNLPRHAPDADDSVVALDIVGPAQVVPGAVEKLPEGTVRLGASGAKLAGGRVGVERKDGEHDNLGYWTDAGASATWTPDVPAGLYDVTLVLACDDGAAGNDYLVDVGEQQLRATVRSTGSWDEFEPVTLGRVTIASGPTRVTVRPAGTLKYALMNLQEIRLTPVKGTR